MSESDEGERRVHKRAAFFAGISQRISDHYPTLRIKSEFRADAPILLARVYFLLSDAYKPIRNFPDSLTDDFKKAAISAIAVMVIRPFSPLDPDRVDDEVVYLANPMLALACANSWAADRNLFEHFPHDYLKRFYITLLNVRMPALDGFIEAANGGDLRKVEPVSLSPQEISILDDWVLKIFMLVNFRR